MYVLFPTVETQNTLLHRTLSAWVEEGRIRLIDRFCALAVASAASSNHAMMAVLACISSVRRGNGHVCMALSALAGQPMWQLGVAQFGFEWASEAALDSGVVGLPGQPQPLILDRDSLYLHRGWAQECAVADALLQRIEAPCADLAKVGIPPGLDQQQSLAVEAMMTRPLCVVSGGPGTGKTHVVAVAVALLLARQPELKIALAAPTGKAAARLQQALQQASLTQALSVQTLHRLLAWSPAARQFRYHAQRHLDLDYLVVDEVSMLDLELMDALLQALPMNCRLVLLGDKDQLASVQAGSVLADICAGAQASRHASLAASVIVLNKNYRFAADSAIARLAQAVNSGASDQVVALLEAGDPEVHWFQPTAISNPECWLEERVPRAFREALVEAQIDRALNRLEAFRILCAHRYGPMGSQYFNGLLRNLLPAWGCAADPSSGVREGELVMITANDYRLDLYNGDIGLVRGRGDDQRVWFATAEGGVRALRPSRLQASEAAFALTVHKCQGSEFDHIVLVLPEPPSPLLTRELLYTALTRARSQVSILASQAALVAAVSQGSERGSGLAQRLG